MKIIKERTVKYYVTPSEDLSSIHGGPFDTRSEAMKSLKAYRSDQRSAAKSERLRVRAEKKAQRAAAAADAAAAAAASAGSVNA